MRAFLAFLTGLIFGTVNLPEREDDRDTAMESQMDREARHLKTWLFTGVAIVAGLLVVYYRFLR